MAARSSNYSISVFRYIVKSTGTGNAWNCGAGHLDEDNMQIICVAHWNAELVLPGWLMRWLSDGNPATTSTPLLCTLFTKFNFYYLRSEPHKFAHSMNGWVGELETNHRSCHPLQASCNGPFLLMPRCMLKWLNKWPNLQFGDEMTEVGEEEKEKH